MTPITTVSVVPEQYKVVLDNYASILEKTNNQLGLWLSLSNLAVGILSVIIAIVAILVGYALWKNSDEQKKKFREFLESQEKISKESITRFEELSKKGRDEAKKKLQILIIEQEKALSSATAANKKEIQKAIDSLKKDEATIGAYTISTPIYQPGFYSSITGTSPLTVTGVNTTTASGVSLGSCPRCGMFHSSGSLYCPYYGNTGI
ncbi:MAG: hypothetical protein WC735_03430 [Candidatus Paceibacterota bacterium]|jgi:gas vesicle protein